MSNSEKFSGKSILVVGGTGGLGRAITRRLGAEGGTLTLTGRNREKLQEMDGLPGVASVLVDVTDPEARAQLAGAVDSQDGVVFAAGIAPLSPVKYLKDGVMESCQAINSVAPLMLVRDLLKQKKLNAGASIVWISSIAAARGTAGYAAYAGSKGALEAQARCLALELAPKRIRVNCIAPGMVETEMADKAAEEISRDALDAHLAAYPLGAGTGADIAAVVSFLLSSDARWITGATLPVDGGFSI